MCFTGLLLLVCHSKFALGSSDRIHLHNEPSGYGNISFFGATGTVTGSRFFLEAAGKRVPIDCGMFQGIREIRQDN